MKRKSVDGRYQSDELRMELCTKSSQFRAASALWQRLLQGEWPGFEGATVPKDQAPATIPADSPFRRLYLLALIDATKHLTIRSLRLRRFNEWSARTRTTTRGTRMLQPDRIGADKGEDGDAHDLLGGASADDGEVMAYGTHERHGNRENEAS